MAQAQLYLFGAPRLEKGGRTVEMDTRKALALLAYLALGDAAPRSGQTRDALALLFYPESDQASARAALRRTLSPLRKALDETCLEADRDRLSLQPGCLWVDVLAFKQLLADTRMHGHPSTQVCSACLPLLEQAVSLYQDGFMSGFSLRDSPAFDDWQFFEAEALRLEFCGVLERLTLGLAAQGDFKTAAAYTRRWQALDSLSEEAHRQLMLVFAWDGQRNAALRQYRECVRILDQELGVSPLEQTSQLYQAILENRIPEPPSLASAPDDIPQKSSTPTPAFVDERRGWGSNLLPSPIGRGGSWPSWQSQLRQLRGEGGGNELNSNPETHMPASGLSLPLRPQLYPLVGRTFELESLLQAYKDAEDPGNRGAFFVLEGEAGIGKTRLAEEFLAQVMSQGTAVLRARCYESEAGLAYAPFLNGLGELLAFPDAAHKLQGVSPAVLSLAAQLVPGLAELFPGLPNPPVPDSPGAQALFLDALRGVIKASVASAAAIGSLGVIFLDDLQWADQASLDLLDYLTHRLEGVFLLAAWRSDLVPSDHRLRRMVAQAAREHLAAILTLPPLRMQDVTELAAASPIHFTDELRRDLFRDTEGNPFFVTAYLEAYQRRATQAGALDGEMPQSVRSLLLARFFGVSEVGRQLLSAAAVLGRSFDFSILREVSGRSDMEMVTALEELVQGGLLLEHNPAQPPTMDDLHYDFSHEKLRETVYDQASLARRRLLHGRAAEAFTARARLHREAAALAAFHYRLAGQLSQAAQWFQQAGIFSREVYANQEAIFHFQSALACGHPDPAVLHEAVGDLYRLTGLYPAALASYEAAAASCPAHHLPWIEHKLGSVHNQLGNYELGECHLQAAFEELEPGTGGTAAAGADAERAMVVADWSHTAYRRGDAPRALQLAWQAARLADSCQDERALAQAYNNLGILERATGDYDQALLHLKGSLELAEKLDEPGSRAAALNNLARVYAGLEQYDQALQLTQQALELCEQRGDRHRAAALHNNLADLFHAAGQEAEAMEHLRRAVVIFAELGIDPSGAVMLPEIWKLSEW